jgi:hypothetical protein
MKLTRRVVVIVAIVIVVVPVALGAPAMFVFVPPAMVVVPAILARFAQLVPRMIRLLALASMMLDGFVKAMVRFGDSLLAIVVISAQSRSAAEEQASRQRRTGQRDFACSKNSRLKFRLHSMLLCF